MSVNTCQVDGALAPPDVTFVTSELRPYLAGLLAREQTAWKEQGAPWSDPLEARTAYVDGGKALRPRFCYWGHAIGGEDASTLLLLQASAALELLHAFALIHDDLMDNSDTRRGRPALHREIAAQHRRHGWAEDPDGYGGAMALLTGDLAFAIASRLATTLPGPALTVWHRMVDQLVLGQFLDLAGTARQDRSHDVARTIALLKSGQYNQPLQVLLRDLPGGAYRFALRLG
jgi:geranylgeranyl diphosphate synthase, type I